MDEIEQKYKVNEQTSKMKLKRECKAKKRKRKRQKERNQSVDDCEKRFKIAATHLIQSEWAKGQNYGWKTLNIQRKRDMGELRATT